MQDDVGLGMADEEADSLDPNSRSSGPSRRAEDSDGMAILAVEVAVIFLFKVWHKFVLSMLMCIFALLPQHYLHSVMYNAMRRNSPCCVHLCS